MQTKKTDDVGAEPSAAAVAQTIDLLLEKAIAHGATDVHIEPRERATVVRVRVDGWLQPLAKLPLPALADIAQQLKARTNLLVTETRKPQAGAFTFAANRQPTEISLAVMPTVSGEKISLHFQPQLKQSASLESLGYWGNMLTYIENAVAEPHGLVAVASPSRASASLGLFGIVQRINNPILRIATLEDPIDYRIAGLNQTQVDTANGVSASTALQMLLKQNPDVLLIGNLQEPRTLELAIKASARDQLILGGVNADSAAQALGYILHMHVEVPVVAASLKIILAQRFVRQLCSNCREAYRPTAAAGQKIKRIVTQSGVSSMRALHELELQALAAGLGVDNAGLGTTPKGITQFWRPGPHGCHVCDFTGYKGRLGVCEVLVNAGITQQLIGGQPTAETLQTAAIASGMRPLQLDGLIKALRGLATLEAVLSLAI